MNRSNEPKYAEHCARLRQLAAALSIEATVFQRSSRVFDVGTVGVDGCFLELEEHLQKLRAVVAAINETVLRHQVAIRAYEHMLLHGPPRDGGAP